MTQTCGCCSGIEPVTPVPILNRPGLSALAYRVGTHASFLETMLARLSAYPELKSLKTRLDSDPAIAFLDAWATVADVLSFYQERIANEGYLRTATERQSILELGRLVGYRLRPGVAASVYLAYTIEKDQSVEIVPGNRAQSLPAPGELPQSFETSDPLLAKAAWNQLKPRLTRPQRLSSDGGSQLYFQGITTNLKPNDPLLFVTDGFDQPVLRRIEQVELQQAENRTRVTLQPLPILSGERSERSIQTISSDRALSRSPDAAFGSDSDGSPDEKPLEIALQKLDRLVAPLTKPPSLQPPNSLQLRRDIAKTFALEADNNPRLLTAFQPRLADALYNAWQSISVQDVAQPRVTVYALRARASVFGHNALKRSVQDGREVFPPIEWKFTDTNDPPAPQPLNLVLFLTPGSDGGSPSGSSSGSPSIRLAASSPPAPLWLLTTRLTIGDQTVSDEGRQLSSQGQTFSIPPANNPTAAPIVTVTVSQFSSTAQLPLMLEFAFPNRQVTLQVGIDANQRLQINSSGSDPTQILLQSTSAQPSSSTPGTTDLFSSRESELNNGVTITVDGNFRQTAQFTETSSVLWLDATYGQILPQSWIVIDRPQALGMIPQRVISRVAAVSERSRNDYSVSAKATRIELERHRWIDPSQDTFQVIRETAVFAQSEALTLAEEPILDIVGASSQTSSPADEIELSQLYRDLEAGRWIIVSGERADLPGASGVRVSELVMLAGVEQRLDDSLRGDTAHTVLRLAQPLAYQYKRDTVTLFGNVVKATHGETRAEVLGSGNASQSLQAFKLQQAPVTYLAAPTAAGSVSTLQVRVNDILWHEADSLATLTPTDRNFITQTDDQNKTTVIFGNGHQGARPPSGVENIKATYRVGIGLPGNVKAEQISLLATRPLGVKSVINLLPAAGGADRESRDQGRRNLPLALLALDRLVSVSDYADFARTFAGIGKASAARLSDGQRQLIHLTIAGTTDQPIDVNSDLYQNLLLALKQFGDPQQSLRVELRELLLLVISAKVKILPDFLWEAVAPQIRAALLEQFSFDRRQLGQPAYLSDVIRTIQQIPGVAYVDVDAFGGIPEKDDVDTFSHQTRNHVRENATAPQRLTLPPSEIARRLQGLITNSQETGPAPVISVNLAGSDHGLIHPAQIAYLTPAVPDTLILNQIPS
jgi:predicted phage baseplate assembly protein